jgi:hypothetical protein
MSTSTRMKNATALGQKPRERQIYVSATETRLLLVRSAPARAQRLRVGDMLSVAQAAAAAGVTDATMKAWIKAGRAIALPSCRGGPRLPAWQFAPAIWDALPALSSALDWTGPWRLLGFLETPLGGLAGLTPRQSLEQGGLQRVLALAAEEA